MARALKSKTMVMKDQRKEKKTATTKRSKGTFLKVLPESVEHIEIVQHVAGVLEELQKRVLDVKEEANKELKKLMKRYETNYRGLEKKVHAVTLEAKRQAQTNMIHLLQKWHEHKEKLPKPLAKELERIIGQIGARMVAKTSSARTKAKNTEAPIVKKRIATRVKTTTGISAKRTLKPKKATTQKIIIPQAEIKENETT